MPSLNTIPLAANSAWYTLPMTIQGIGYVFEFRWNSRAALWVWDIGDISANPILRGVPMLVNQNLLAQYPNAALPNGKFFVADMTGKGQQAGLTSFGISHNFFFMDPS